MSVNVYDANTHVLKVALQAGGDCADYADIKRAKQFGKDCAAVLGPNQAGINYEDTTAPPGGDNSAAARRQNRHFDGDPSTQVPVWRRPPQGRHDPAERRPADRSAHRPGPPRLPDGEVT